LAIQRASSKSSPGIVATPLRKYFPFGPLIWLIRAFLARKIVFSSIPKWIPALTTAITQSAAGTTSQQDESGVPFNRA